MDATKEALRNRNKIRSTSESSALDNFCPVTGQQTMKTNGNGKLCVDHHRKASKSAVHLGGGGDDHPPCLLEHSHGGNCTLDWWFHRKRRSSKNNKSR